MHSKSLFVGGIPINVFSSRESGTRPVLVLFLLHGRKQRSEDYIPVIKKVFDSIKEEELSRSLYIVTFDQRNHGHRLVDSLANELWKTPGIDEPGNDRHALDMYSIQTGTARDVSFLIDFLPSYLFPAGEREIVEWGVAGISLGGHSTWISLRHEPRVTVGIPIIGCPDYLSLIAGRADKCGLSLDDPKYMPDSLLRQVNLHDPASAPYRIKDPSNPFFGKKILVLSGADDQLVPWVASEKFVEGLEVGENGIKKVIVEEGTGHTFSPTMVAETIQFLKEICCSGKCTK